MQRAHSAVCARQCVWPNPRHGVPSRPGFFCAAAAVAQPAMIFVSFDFSSLNESVVQLLIAFCTVAWQWEDLSQTLLLKAELSMPSQGPHPALFLCKYSVTHRQQLAVPVAAVSQHAGRPDMDTFTERTARDGSPAAMHSPPPRWLHTVRLSCANELPSLKSLFTTVPSGEVSATVALPFRSAEPANQISHVRTVAPAPFFWELSSTFLTMARRCEWGISAASARLTCSSVGSCRVDSGTEA